MRIVLSGPPSVGKSTQAKRLGAALGVPHVSSGGLIRQRARTGDLLAMQLLETVANGNLAPSNGIISLVRERLSASDCHEGFVLDGFPRKAEEAAALLDLCAETPLDAFLVLSASPEALMERVTERSRQSSMFRPEDEPEYFPRRIAAYVEQTMRVGEIMNSHGVPVIEINAEVSPDDVATAICEALRFEQQYDSEMAMGQQLFG